MDNTLKNKANEPDSQTILRKVRYLKSDSEQPENRSEITESLKKEAQKYIRVGIDYYRLSEFINARRQKIQTLQPWSKSIIINDHGKEILRYIKQYISFVNIPDNKPSYQKEHKNNQDLFYNIYSKPEHVPQPGDCSLTISFISRIFQDKTEVALDYLKILYEDPTQNLPVICLVSRAQGTGKSAFMLWLCSLFGQNAIILGNEEFSSNFNSLFSSKLVICIDESFIEKKIIKEKIKRLTTAKSINMEAKGKDAVRMDFFGKFVLSSNTEDNFIKMDEDDNRFFVVKVPTLTREDYIHDLDAKLKEQIPAFLSFLVDRQFVYPKTSRLWFDPKVYETEALMKIKTNTRSFLEKEILRFLGEIFSFEEVGDFIYVTPTLLSAELEKSSKNVQASPTQIIHILKKEWELMHESNMKFVFPFIEGNHIMKEDSRDVLVPHLGYKRTTGTCYLITREFYNSKIEFE